MTLLQIKYFMEAAKHCNFTEAARVLYIAQPVVTRQVAALEKELGFRLFIRKAKGVELTEPGELMYRTLLRCEEEFNSALRHSRKMVAQESRLVLGLLSSVELYNVSAGIHAFLDQHQETAAEFRRLSVFEIYPALERREIDLAIVFDTSVPEDKDICFYRLFPSRDFIVTSKNSPLKGLSCVGAEELRDYCVVQERPRNNLYASPFGPQAEICGKLGLEEKNVIYCDNYESCLSTVEHGSGIMVIDELTVFPNKDNFCLINTGLVHYVSVAWNASKTEPLAKELAEWLKTTLP